MHLSLAGLPMGFSLRLDSTSAPGAPTPSPKRCRGILAFKKPRAKLLSQLDYREAVVMQTLVPKRIAEDLQGIHRP